MGAAAADPRRGIEEEIEFPEIADAPWTGRHGCGCGR
jgi:hypothetical protein